MSHRNMKEELTCPICMELFRQPRRLPCGHSYCYICLKAMLDRCTEFSGLYLDYSRSLVCPECREEVSIETDRGVDMIPPDFKLSKLVDLFKFMKKNDSSDSSCDELQSSNSAAPADSAPTSVPTPAPTPATTAAAEVISLPAAPPSTGASSSQASHLFTAAATVGRPTQPVHVSPPSTVANASTSTVSTISQLQSRNTHQHVESSSEEAISATASSPSMGNQADAEYNSGDATADAISSTAGPVATLSGEISVSNTCHVHRDACLNNLPLATVSAVTTPPGPSQSRVSAVGTQLHTVGVSVSSARPGPVSLGCLTNWGRNPSEELSSVSEQGTDAGVEALRDHVNGSSVRPEQHVDSLEILSNWVNENHFYSQGSRNLSHSAVSLPVEVVLEEAESCHENSPELTSSVARATRAQSVPTETREWHRSAQPGGSGEHVASKSLHVKARKVKRGVFSRFVDSDTSSDSSSNNGRQQQRLTGRPKRWLMTRFLRSVILSDSSSTDYSDDDDEEERNATSSHRERKAVHSVQNNLSTAHQQNHQQAGAVAAGSSQEAYHQRIPESNHNTVSNAADNVTLARRPTDGAQSHAASQQHNLSASEKNRNTASTIPETVPRSIDSSTLAKEPAGGREDTLSCADTLPKPTHSWKSAGDGQHTAPVPFPAAEPYGQDGHLFEHRSESFDAAAHIPHRVSSSARRRPGEQTQRTHLPGAGSPPTFYDNLNALSDGGEGRTLYDNVGTEGASHDGEGSQVGLVRDLRLNPCHRQQSLEWTSEHGHGRTLYDNVDSHHTQPEQTSTRSDYGHIHSRNPVTDIDDLKTGFEHYHTGNINIIVADTTEPDAGRCQEASHILHMGELNNSTTGLFQSSQASQHPSEHLPEPGYVCSSSSSLERGHRVSTGHVPVNSGNHHSLYDNMNNSHSLAGPQGAAGVSKRVHHTEGGTLSEASIARYAQRDRHAGAGHPNTFSAPGRHGDDELQYVDNYLDHYSDQFRNAASAKSDASAKSAAFAKSSAAKSTAFAKSSAAKSAAFAKSSAAKSAASAKSAAFATKSAASASAKNGDSSGKTVGRVNSQTSVVGVAAHRSAETASASVSAPTSVPTAGCGSQATGATACERRHVESRNVVQDDADMEVVDSENGSNSSTSLQDKKKPRSRLKKFLTSLLSLSSSSDDDDQPPGETSSESSDW